MKEYTRRDLKWISKIDGRYRPPEPFPGRYPTRIAVWGECGRIEVGMLGNARPVGPRKEIFYIGKPSCNVGGLIRSIIRGYCHTGNLFVMEFDKSGGVALGNVHLPTDFERIMPMLYHPFLKCYYHPFELVSYEAVTWCIRPFYIKRLIHRGKMMTVYSPEVSLTDIQLRAHKSWLETNLKS